LVALAAFILTGPPAPAQPANVSVQYSRSASALVVRYVHAPGEIREADPGVSVEAYGDGRVRVHYPAYMKRAGNYEAQLSSAELDLLLETLIAAGVADFDPGVARQAKQASRARTMDEAPDLEVTDAPTTVIELHVDGFTAGGRAAGRVDRTVSWSGLQFDAQQFPSVDALQGLAAAERALQALQMHPALERID
jgi:hypothetical protein